MARRSKASAAVSGPIDPRLEQFKEWFRTDRDYSHHWRLEARECYDYRDGNQWSQEDMSFLQLQNRPVVTFNRTGSVVDSVCGLEVSNRQEVRYIPRQVGASGVNDLLTSAGKWVRDECNAEDEESDAFSDLITCGMGWTETRLDYDEDPQGKLIVSRVNPLEMFWDSSARGRNIADAKRLSRVRDVPIEEARKIAPDATDDELHAGWAVDQNAESKEPHDAMQAPYYRNDQSPDIDKRTSKVRMVEVQWYEVEEAVRIVDPMTGQPKTLSKEDFGTLQDRMDQIRTQGLQEMPELISAPAKRRIYKRAILGAKVLKEWDGPKEGGFTYKCMTGKRDQNKGIWYGLVRAMIDPQKWANKFFSQTMHIMNTNAKGGLLAEVDAFENPQEAEETWADPNSITLLAPGALSNNKVKEKQLPQLPPAPFQLMQFAISSIRDVSGVNLELLGMQSHEQPGILEHQRKQAGMTILAGFFDSLRHYRKDQGRLMLWYITNFLTDGRLIKIGGQENAQYVRLVRDPNVTEYDVIVDDTPSSPNQKEQVWGILVQMMPVLAKLQVPMPVWLSLLEYSPLPASLVSKLNQFMQQQQQSQPQQDPKMIEAQAKVQVAQSQAQSHQATAQAEMMRANADVQAAQLNARAQAMKTMAEGQRAQAQAHAAHQDSNTNVVQMLIDAMMTANQQQQQAEQAQTAGQ